MLQEHQMSLNTVVVDNVATAEAYRLGLEYVENQISLSNEIFEEAKKPYLEQVKIQEDLIRQIEILSVRLVTIGEANLSTLAALLTEDYQIHVRGDLAHRNGYTVWIYSASTILASIKKLTKPSFSHPDVFKHFYEKQKSRLESNLMIASSAIYPFPVLRSEAVEIQEFKTDPSKAFEPQIKDIQSRIFRDEIQPLTLIRDFLDRKEFQPKVVDESKVKKPQKFSIWNPSTWDNYS